MAPKTPKSPLLLPAPSLHSGVKTWAVSGWLRLNQLATPGNVLLILVSLYLLLSGAFTASFFIPRSVNFSFSGRNCFTSPTLLPDLIAKRQSDSFTATPIATLTIAGHPIYSQTTCITPTKAPVASTVEHIKFSPLGVPMLAKNISVAAGQLPTVNYRATLKQPLATDKPLVFTMDSVDKVFTYQLEIDSHKLACTKIEQAIACDITKLGLAQSASYSISLVRLFAGQPQTTLFRQTVETVGAVTITNSSIAAGQTVFDAPSTVTLTLSKPAKTVGKVQLTLVAGDQRQLLPVSASLNGQTITVQFGQTLPRSSSFELSIDAISAADGGHLPALFVLTFTTSGGPKVKSANIGSYKVAPSANVVLAFDSNISAAQNLANFIQLDVNGQPVAASVTHSGSIVTINPSQNLPTCTHFTVRVLDGLQNEFGISGGSAWQFGSRTICQTSFSIGTSVQGRSIIAYRFGHGSSYVVYVGGTHGNEQSSVYTLNSWLDYLERNYDQIPAQRTIIVIPNLNPDGYAKSQRTNANNVDLNRNFPTNNWKQGVTMPGGSYNPNGGGSAPLSEPESKALADYVLSVHPRLVLTYHATAGVVIPNDSGDSVSLAQTYDQKSNLNFESNGQTSTIFNYDTTGAFEDWLHDKQNLPALLIELWTLGSNEFGKNQNAMWFMAQIGE